ncbi:MAG: 2-oxo acid dehydrogenase subunit E2 [Candidatus Eisenbacteria bacterium]|uniref:2-oxo acid dehydrogenase subunit E2 n=1 Tax=Eiseniibacteriota bacterium TaxID=2212470 RepID=A0A538SFH0_UNCEI|nr:MAG: 2-oxo acid dehydrogenase subunit E2 [Candidatus Eisenbacteria bacterium]
MDSRHGGGDYRGEEVTSCPSRSSFPSSERAWPRARCRSGSRRWATAFVKRSRWSRSRPTRSTWRFHPRRRARSSRSWCRRGPRSWSEPRSACWPTAGRRPRRRARRRPRARPRRLPPGRRQALAPERSSPAVTAPGAAASGGDGETWLGESRNLSPAVRRLMREHQVGVEEIGRIRGSGVAGRVTRDDLMDYLKTRGAPTRLGVAPAAPAPPREAGPRPGFLSPSTGQAAAAGPREEVVPFTKVRKLIAENMVKSKHTAPHVTTFDEVDMTAVVELRKEWTPRLEPQGVKLTYMPFFIKASVFALREFPWVNGTVRGDSIVLRRYYNIGMAVGRDEKGLIVPNLKDCDRKNLVQIAAEVNDLAARARADRLRMEEIEGGTFSITNAGVFGATNSAPIINFPEVAILGVHKIVERPVIRGGQIVPRHMMNVALSFDHRVIDGELAVKFLRRVSELLERPELLWFYA